MASRGWQDMTLADIERHNQKIGRVAVPIKAHKYHAEPTTIDGIRFDSKKEAVRWTELQLLERAGEIQNLSRQVPYALHAWCKASGLAPSPRYEIGQYVADFVYEETGRPIIEDCKGFQTALYKWKKKHMEAQYGITIREV